MKLDRTWVALLISLIALGLSIGLPLALSKSESKTPVSKGVQSKPRPPLGTGAGSGNPTPAPARVAPRPRPPPQAPTHEMLLSVGVDPRLARGMVDEDQMMRFARSNMPGGTALAAGLARGGMMIDRDMDEGTFSALAASDTM